MGDYGALAAIGGIFTGLLAFFKFFLDRQIRDLDRRVIRCEERWDAQRTRSHLALEELSKADLIMHYVHDRLDACTCDALEVVAPSIERYIAGLPERNAVLKEMSKAIAS